MTEQQKPMHLATGKDRVEVWLNRPTKKEPIAIFFDPDREANARLFMHAGKLVEAVKSSREALADWIQYVPAWAREKHGMDAELARIDAILAKIEGKS